MGKLADEKTNSTQNFGFLKTSHPCLVTNSYSYCKLPLNRRRLPFHRHRLVERFEFVADLYEKRNGRLRQAVIAAAVHGGVSERSSGRDAASVEDLTLGDCTMLGVEALGERSSLWPTRPS